VNQRLDASLEPLSPDELQIPLTSYRLLSTSAIHDRCDGEVKSTKKRKLELRNGGIQKNKKKQKGLHGSAIDTAEDWCKNDEEGTTAYLIRNVMRKKVSPGKNEKRLKTSLEEDCRTRRKPKVYHDERHAIQQLKLLCIGKYSSIDDIISKFRSQSSFPASRDWIKRMLKGIAKRVDGKFVGKSVDIHYKNDGCYVCFEEDEWGSDVIVYCDMCNISVHQDCYGIVEIPEGNWYCDPCMQRHQREVVDPGEHILKEEEAQCCLCAFPGGALKPVEGSTTAKWAHITCATLLPEVGFGDADLVTPVQFTDKVDPKRYNTNSYICKCHPSIQLVFL
jgi:hypothetical protein